MKRKILDFMLTACCMAFSFLGLVACDNELDIRQEYPFTVETMPVADEITDGETVEIRLEIKPEGNFAGTVYTLRYFQPDGKGSLKMEDGTVLKPNDRYLLNEWKFRLYYTSQSGKESQTIDLYLEDNWGNLQQLTYDLMERIRMKKITRRLHERIPAVMIFLLLVLYGKAENPPSDKDKAVACIKRWEGWHRGKMPYIGYGHRLLPHETLTENLSEAQADSLLRCDLERCLKVFRKYGKDSLLLSLLGFNVGCYRLIGNGKIPKSKLIQKLDSGNRDIYREYVSFRCYRGKVIPSIERRRKEEFELFYIP